ncbi:MAG: hypothetical protein JSR17_08850 [Proteobacteria bacterium]|nr:hypothetical protein [Pseudomonadota bacterium]
MASQGPQAEQQIIYALYHFLIESAHAAPSAIAQGLEEICAKGDILCESTEGRYHLPLMMSNIIAAAEEKTGISRYISGPIALAAVGGIVSLHLWRKYNLKGVYDTIRDLIKAEFGAGKIATELFNTFKKGIEDAVDEKIRDFTSKYATIAKENPEFMAQRRKDFLNEIINNIVPTLLNKLRENKEALTQQATSATEAVNEVLAQKAIPGMQQSPVIQAQAKAHLQEFVVNNFIKVQKDKAGAKAKI